MVKSRQLVLRTLQSVSPSWTTPLEFDPRKPRQANVSVADLGKNYLLCMSRRVRKKQTNMAGHGSVGGPFLARRHHGGPNRDGGGKNMDDCIKLPRVTFLGWSLGANYG